MPFLQVEDFALVSHRNYHRPLSAPTVLQKDLTGGIWIHVALGLGLFFAALHAPLCAQEPPSPSPTFSVQLKLKIHGAIDLSLLDRPFSFARDLLADTTAAMLKSETGQFKTATEIDSTYQTVKIRRTLNGKDFVPPVVFDMPQYIQYRLKQDLIKQFRDESIKNLQKLEITSGGEALTIEVPFKIKSKTFNKIFGGDRVRLRISGNVNITGGFRREGRSQIATVTGQQTDYSFHIDQTQRFKITGEIGDKVSVEVDQDSERMFEFENALKLTYTGYEDEVIQKIEAGNISLQLAGTQLATFSGQNKGLFGLKADMKIGPLKLTTIASLEKGEKNKLTISGGAQQSAQMIDVTQPSVGRYFFLHQYYRERYRIFNENMTHTFVQDSAVDGNTFYLYKQHPITPGSTIPAGLIFAWAVYDSLDVPEFYEFSHVDSLADSLIQGTYLSNRNYQPGYYLLVDPSQYHLDTQSGYVRLNSVLSANDVLAVAYKNTNEDVYGDLTPPTSLDSTAVLKLLRPANSLPTDDTWPLAWRNVYNLGGVNVEEEGFNMRITYQPSGAAEIETLPYDGSPTTFLTLFGLDTRNATGQPQPDGIADDNPALLSYNYGEVIFPDLQPFDPEGYFILTQTGGLEPGPYFADSAAFPDSLKIPSIYDSTIVYPSNFKIKADYKSVQATYDLGINVLEGSEEVYLGGAKLQKGSDYVIDYYSGSLTILNEAALSPSANLQILYESGEVFQLDKKTLLGVRGEYQLWDQSFIGATALYLNEKPLQDRVKIGNEPLRNFLWDLNTRLVFKPNFLTTAIDHLPLIETEAPSQFTTEVEYAQVHPNPNSLNNSSTGDPNGVAYVDDFESIKKTTPLGIMRRQWTLSSFPAGESSNKKRGAVAWFNPFDQVTIQDIWPNRPTNSNVAQRTHVLSFYFIPTSPDTTVLTKGTQFQQSWGGVMRSLTAGYANQSKSKYIEIMLKVNEQGSGYDPPGKLHIDMGQISEDVIPNNQLNTEDQNLSGLLFGNGLLDPGEDVGLDGVDGNDPSDHWIIPSGNGPASMDDWAYSPSNPYDVWNINGTEGNQNDEGGRYPDTEDLDKDGTLDAVNNFFRYTVDLSETEVGPIGVGAQPPGQWSPSTNFLISPPNSKHWKLYRIPIEAAETVGSPNLTQIEFVRVWMDNFADSSTYEVSIATLEIVGNEWEAIPIVTPADSSYERVAVEIINTYDNPQYTAPPGVAGYRDPVTDIVSQEQSLLLRMNDIPRDSAGIVVRRLYDMQDYLEYKKLKMFVHGGSFNNEAAFDTRDIWMYFRFGADTVRNYYEYRQKVYPGWDARNNIEIDLAQLTHLKIERPNATDFYSIMVNGGDSLGVMGNPSLSQVRQFTAGIIPRDYDVHETDNLEIWLDELRVSDVKKEIGRAVRASADLTLADLATLHTNVDASDGNFHNVNTRTGTRSNSLSGSATGSLQLQKFLDPKWGVAIPITGNYSQSETVPDYFPNSDILVNKGDALQVDSVKNLNQNYGAGIDFSKNTPSASYWLKYTLDKLSGGYDYAHQESSNPTTLYSRSTTHSANAAYNLTFGRPGINFLTWLKSVPVLKKYANTKMYPLITKLNLSLTGTEAITKSQLRAGTHQFSHTFFLTKGVASGLHPFDNLTLDYNRTHKADFLMDPAHHKGVEDILRGDLGWDEDVDVSQSLNASYTPRMFSWLDTDARYNTSYHWQWGQGYISAGQSISNNNTLSLSGTFKLTQILKKPGAVEPGGRRSLTPGEQPPPPPGTGEPGKGGSEKGGSESGLHEPPVWFSQEQGTGFNPYSQTLPGDTTRQDTTQVGGDTTRVDTTSRELIEIAKPKRQSALLDFWYGVRYTVTRLRDIRLEYTQQNNWSDPLVDGQAGLFYQLGLNSGDYQRLSSTQNYSGFPSRSRSDDYKVRSGLDFAKNFKVNLNYNYRWSKSQSNTVNGTVTESQLYFFKTSGDSVRVFQIPIPEWSIQWTGWEKFAAFQKIAETVSLDHSFTGSRTTTWNDNRANVTKYDYTRNFSPLLGVNMTFKRGITSTLRYNWTETGTVAIIPTASKSRNRQSNLQLSASYSLKTGFRIPIPVWPFKNKRFKNNTTFSLTFNMSNSRTENEAAGKFTETGFNKTWSIKPAMDYTFSNTVTGGMHFEYGSNNSKNAGTSNYQEFGININITIRG